MACDAQLQLEVFPHTHEPIVLAPALFRLLSRPGDMSSFICVPAPIELRVALLRPYTSAASPEGFPCSDRSCLSPA
jgi:hypothetical protein